MASFDDDFGDDEDFGLSGDGHDLQTAPSSQTPAGGGGAEDMEEDLYGDLAGDDDQELQQDGTDQQHAPTFEQQQFDFSSEAAIQQQHAQAVHAARKASQAPIKPPPSNETQVAGIPVQALDAVKQAAKIATVKLQPAGSAVYVANLSWWTTDADVEQLCSEAGTVINIQFLEEPYNGKSLGAAFVEYREENAAVRCRDSINDRVINGRHVVVALADSVSAAAAVLAGPLPGAIPGPVPPGPAPPARPPPKGPAPPPGAAPGAAQAATTAAAPMAALMGMPMAGMTDMSSLMNPMMMNSLAMMGAMGGSGALGAGMGTGMGVNAMAQAMGMMNPMMMAALGGPMPPAGKPPGGPAPPPFPKPPTSGN